LPETHPLWGGKRDFKRYADDIRKVADSAYGRRRPFTVGIYDDGRLVTSCKLYDREIRWGAKTLRATGIGAVFTPPNFRGRGYASALIGAVLDRERNAGQDAAFLFSDIHPVFYAKLGFVALPSRLWTVRASDLDGSRSGGTRIERADWPLVRRCFEDIDSRQRWSLKRTPLVWSWMRGMWSGVPPPSVQRVQLKVRKGGAVIAYVIGRRVTREDTFVVDDFAFAGDAGRARVPALLRAGAGDLRRVAAWLPPAHAREALPRGSVRARKDAIFMVAPISPAGREWWRANHEAALHARSDAVWGADHV
jgi:predicted N-acetyltransferase YhbS